MKYMKLLFAVFMYTVGYAQANGSNISGYYVLENADSKQHIEIFGNKFIYAVFDDYLRDVIYANATFKHVDDNFIELRSKNGEHQTYTVKQSNDIFKSNALYVSISYTNKQTYGQKIYVCYLLENKWEQAELMFDCPNHHISFTLPQGVKKFTLSIVPTIRKNVNPANFTYFLDGNLYFKLPELEVVENINNVYIEIKNLSRNYFEMYSVDGEYAKIEDDRIVWRGQIFKKSYDKLDLMYIEEMDKNPDVNNRYNVRNGLLQKKRKVKR